MHPCNGRRPPRSGPGDGNSEIIRGICAERQNQASDSAIRPLTWGVVFPSASAFVAAAKAAADQAKSAADGAATLLQQIHDIGSAPWKAPLVLVLTPVAQDDGSIDWQSTSIIWDFVGSPLTNELPMDKVAEDPSGGGGIDFVVDCADPVHFVNPVNDFSTCNFRNYMNTRIDVSYTTGLSNNSRRFFGISGVGANMATGEGKILPFVATIKSRATGLTSKVNFTLFSPMSTILLHRSHLSIVVRSLNKVWMC